MKYLNFGPEIGGSSILKCVFCVFFHGFSCQMSYRNPHGGVLLDVLGFWVPQKTYRRRTKIINFLQAQRSKNQPGSRAAGGLEIPDPPRFTDSNATFFGGSTDS